MKCTSSKFLIAAVLFFAGLNSAMAVIIEDTYQGSNGHGYGDVIGNSRYQIDNMDVNIIGDFLNVRVNTNFTAAGDPYGIDFGDLFISTDGWNPYGDSPYTADNAANGEDWEFVFDTSSGALFGGEFSTYLSDDLISSRYIFRNGQEVQRNQGGTSIAGSSVNLSSAGTGGFVEYNILLSSLGFTGGSIGLKWGMTCANDTIEGAFSVPEPGALLLLSIGLLGIGVSSRKKQK